MDSPIGGRRRRRCLRSHRDVRGPGGLGFTDWSAANRREIWRGQVNRRRIGPAGLMLIAALLAACGSASDRTPSVSSGKSSVKPAAATHTPALKAAQAARTARSTPSSGAAPANKLCAHAMNTSTLFLTCTFPSNIEVCAMISAQQQAHLIGSMPKVWLGQKATQATQPTHPADCTFMNIASVTPTGRWERAQLFCGGYATGNYQYLAGRSMIRGTHVYDVPLESEMAQYEAFTPNHAAEVTLYSDSTPQPSTSTVAAAMDSALAHVAANGCHVN